MLRGRALFFFFFLLFFLFRFSFPAQVETGAGEAAVNRGGLASPVAMEPGFLLADVLVQIQPVRVLACAIERSARCCACPCEGAHPATSARCKAVSSACPYTDRRSCALVCSDVRWLFIFCLCRVTYLTVRLYCVSFPVSFLFQAVFERPDLLTVHIPVSDGFARRCGPDGKLSRSLLRSVGELCFFFVSAPLCLPSLCVVWTSFLPLNDRLLILRKAAARVRSLS